MPLLIWQSLAGLWAVPLVIIAVATIWYRARWQKKAVSSLVSARYRSRFMRHWSPLKTVVKALLLMVGFSSLLVVLLRPSIYSKHGTVVQEGRDLFIALDISRSMLAQDCAPNRLAIAKKKIRQLVATLDAERVGLILFSGSALVQCPLTTDKTAFFMFLDQVDVETISSGTTALDQAIGQALRAFSSMQKEKNKLLVVCTDGEDFSSNLSQVKRAAQQQHLHIVTLGIGTPQGAPIPTYSDKGAHIGHQKDAKGNVVISRLNEEILHALARDSGGKYLRAASDTGDIAKVVQLVRRYEKEKFDEKKYAKLEDLYPYSAALSFICFTLEWLI